MARFYGAIGYVIYETINDIVTEEPVEKMYKGELIKNARKLINGADINDTVIISNQVSILADPYALNHIHAIRYVKWSGGYWKVDSVVVQYPRLILSLGGVYNGKVEKRS